MFLKICLILVKTYRKITLKWRCFIFTIFIISLYLYFNKNILTLDAWFFIYVISLLTIIFHTQFTHIIAQKAPPILVTCGILGTFFGIAYGLLNFNQAKVHESLPKLIDAIKTAFWVSTFGIFCALTIKARDILIILEKKNIASEKPTGSTIDDLVIILKSVQQAIVGNEDSTLLSQMKLARSDSNDKLDILTKSIENFCSKVAESSSKALIEALREVIKDFNTKINEQFGENFKQLNDAVGKLLVWQEQYKQHVEEIVEQQKITTENMTVATHRYEELIEKAEIYTKTANDMSSILNSLDAQKNQIEGSLSLLTNLIESTDKGLPQIEKKIIEMVEQVGNGVKTTNEELKNLMHSVIQSSNQEFNENISKIIDQTKEQVLVLDKSLSEALSKSLESLARQMASLSEKFAEDYSPITEKLQKILEIAR